MSLGSAFAADDNASGGTSSSEDTYTCTDPGGDETPFCVCTTLHACNEMAEDGVCDRQQGRGVVNDTTCNDAPDVEDTSAIGGCFCTWEPLESGAVDRRPSFGDGSVHRNAQEERPNEVVPARRAGVPESETTVEENEEEEPTQPARRVRDHRN